MGRTVRSEHIRKLLSLENYLRGTWLLEKMAHCIRLVKPLTAFQGTKLISIKCLQAKAETELFKFSHFDDECQKDFLKDL